MNRVLLGRVVRAHGIRGALRVRPESGRAAETARSLSAAAELFLDEQKIVLLRIRPERDDLLIEIEGLVDRTAAEAMRGRAVFVDRAFLPAPAADELYLSDLVGCEVVDVAAVPIGRVRGSFHSGAHEILIVDGPDGERLLPYVPHMVVSVDLVARRIVYDPPPGMLDLDEAESG